MNTDNPHEVFCPHCRGGNPPNAAQCMWCQQPMQAEAAPEYSAGGAGQVPEVPTGPSLRALILNEEQDPAVVEQVQGKVTQILTNGEEIRYIAVEKKPGVNLAPDCVVVTNKRLIIYRPKTFGRVAFEDYIWRDLHDATLKESILGATFTMGAPNGQQLSMDHLPKAQARRVYQFAQEMEEFVIEETRQRQMEEQRADAGGIYMQGMPAAYPGQAYQAQPPATPPPGYSAGAAPVQENPVEKLKQLKEMLDGGLISQEMYDAKRNEILSNM